MNKLPTLSDTDLDVITGGRAATPPGGSFNPGGAGQATHKPSFRERVQDKIIEWSENQGRFPYKP